MLQATLVQGSHHLWQRLCACQTLMEILCAMECEYKISTRKKLGDQYRFLIKILSFSVDHSGKTSALWSSSRTRIYVQLKDLVESLEGQLDHELLEHGANVSVGERQLICLTRVLLQQNKVIILDEPTAHVDPHTEQRIWNVVREKLRDFTIITISHRLNTIRDCDKILVLKSREVEKFDGFDTLFYKENSNLREMDQVADT